MSIFAGLAVKSGDAMPMTVTTLATRNALGAEIATETPIDDRFDFGWGGL